MLRFLLVADVRVGAVPAVHDGRALPIALRARMRRDGVRAMERAVAVARERGLDAIAAVGELIDERAAEPADVEALWGAVMAAGRPVVVAPAGAVEPGSYLHARTAELLGGARLPSNLVVLPAPGGVGARIARHLTDLRPADGGALVVEVDDEGVRAEGLELGARRGHLIDLDVTGVGREEALTAHAARALQAAGVGRDDLVWFRVRGVWRHAGLPRLGALPVAHAELVFEDVSLAAPVGTSTAELHLRALAARARAGKSVEALRMAHAAWHGEEVTAPDEDSKDIV
jgi:hypothetical protein